MFSYFVKISAKLGNSIVDWIRSIYFSLFGSSALAFGLKVTTLEINTAIFYALANLCFLWGLFLSVMITNRFRKLEKRFDKEKPAGVEDIKAYYIIQDIGYSFQHFLLYALFIPGFFFIVISGFGIETKTKQNSEIILSNESRIDSSLTVLSKQNQYLILKIDLLNSKVDSAAQKPKMQSQIEGVKPNKAN